MCTAKAPHSANHAMPNPDAESDGGASLKELPVDLILNGRVGDLQSESTFGASRLPEMQLVLEP